MSEEKLKAAGAELKVGVSQLKNPTPKWMSNIANGILFSALAWALISSQLPEIPSHIAAHIDHYLLVASGLVKLATKFFGLQIPEAQ